MKKLAGILILIATLSTQAQSMAQVGWVAKFGVAGGFSPIYVLPDLSPLDSYLNGFGVSGMSNKGVLALGGGGYAYIMVIPNLRIGGMGFGGSISQSGTVNGIQKEAVYSIGGGGFTIEYTLPFIKKAAVSFGAMIGGGSAVLELYQNKGVVEWNDLWADISSAKLNSHKLTNEFFTISPTLNIDIPVTRFIAFRLGAGYLLSFSKEWTVDNQITLNNVPDNLNSSSFFIQTGLYFGFFAF